MRDKSVKHFIRKNELQSIPQELSTNQMYSDYQVFCELHKETEISKNKFTRELRHYGYERITQRQANNKIVKIYKYTGRIPKPCPNCYGKGYIYNQ